MERFITVLDTGASSTFIELDEMPHQLRKKIEPLNFDFNVRNANGKPALVTGTISILVNLSTNTETVRFYVMEKLATEFILRCDFCDINVDTIRPQLKIVPIDNGSAVPIVWQPCNSNTEVPFPNEQQFDKYENRASPKKKVTKNTELHPGMQERMEVSTENEGTLLIETNDQLCNNLLCRAGTGIADIRPNDPFHILVAKFGDHTIDLLPPQVLAYALQHPKTLIESQIKHAGMLGLISYETDTKYRQRHTNVCDIETIRNNLLINENSVWVPKRSPSPQKSLT